MKNKEILRDLAYNIHTNKEEKMIEILEERPFLLERPSSTNGENPFLLSCHNNLQKVIDYLLTKNIDIHCVSKFTEENAIHQAVFTRNESLIKKLYDLGININHKDAFDCTPLIRTCEIGYVSMIKCLMELGADVNYENKYNRSFMYFLKKGYFKLELSYVMTHLDKFNEKNQAILKGLYLKQLVTKGSI